MREDILSRLRRAEYPLWLHGLLPQAKAWWVWILKKAKGGSFLYISSNQEKAENFSEDLGNFLSSEKIFLYSSQDITSFLYRIKEEGIHILSSSLLREKVPSFNSLQELSLRLRKGRKIEREKILKKLERGGYHRVGLVEEKGECAVRGGIIDFFSPFHFRPVRIELLGDEIFSLREFDPSTQRSIKEIECATLVPLKEKISKENVVFSLYELLPSEITLILDEPTEQEEAKFFAQKIKVYLSTLPQRREWMRVKEEIPLSTAPLAPYHRDLARLVEDLKGWEREGYSIFILTPNPAQGKRLRELFQGKGLEIPFSKKFFFLKDSPSPLLVEGDLSHGFICKITRRIFITDEDIFERYKERRMRWGKEEGLRIKRPEELKIGDYVVHIDYGIGQFAGIKELELLGRKREFFQVNYKGTDRLYVPVEQLERLHKYIGDPSIPPPVYSLEGSLWRQTKKRVQEAASQLARELLKLYSTRKVIQGHSFPPDEEWQFNFEASFPYTETPDQLRAVEEVKRDMRSPRPMDRLLLGDAGYGKTEVAMRAAFKAVLDNKQVAVLVPTTILAEQHYHTFSERMATYPINIALLSRFQTPSQEQKILQELKEGKIDILIGTHKILQDRVKFKDLGLVIIDEEQRFGVVQKKKLRKLKPSVDVLTLTSTPIPRTLYMSLTGLRDLSMINTPPPERGKIKTYVKEYSERTVKEAVEKELERGGQVFYLYNRIYEIAKVKEKLTKLIPRARIAVAHGRIPSSRLEKIISDFLHRKYDVLISTTIIESGIDMPNVNTLIVEKAENFGLADLYQLRGRIGRGRREGHAYFFFSPENSLTPEAKERLKSIQEFTGPGSGYRLALQDLEIRGAGNLLGKEQHGHIAAVGFTLYMQLLTQEIKKLRGEKVEEVISPTIEIAVNAYLPSEWVPSSEERIEVYRKAGGIQKREEIFQLKEELRDRFGLLPREALNLLKIIELKILLRELKILSLREEGNWIWATFSPSCVLSPSLREKIRRSLFPLVKPLPGDARNLLLQKREKDGRLLFDLLKILQKLKILIF